MFKTNVIRKTKNNLFRFENLYIVYVYICIVTDLKNEFYLRKENIL